MSRPDGLGQMVRGFRAAAGLTQADLASRAGVSERAISDIERGLRSRVYPVTAQLIADALGLVGDQRAAFERAARSPRPDHAEPGAGAGWQALRRDAFVGRTAELRLLLDALAAGPGRLVTVTGPGGIGKSRLAAEACARLPELRTCWLGLADLDGGVSVIAAVARALGLPADASIPAVAHSLDATPTLLVLDTFEAVVGSAPEVANLLDATVQARVLVTSRMPLQLRGEREIALGALAEPEAAELFRQRAEAVRPGLPADDATTADAMAAIGTRLSGLPLAIELAAARLRHMSLRALAGALDNPLDVLVGGPRDLPERQRTMRATIAWSVDLLTASERRVLRGIARFSSVWGLADALAVQPELSAEEASRVVATLCEHALVLPVERADASPGWRLLDPIREFAWEECVASGDVEPVARRHARRVADLAEAAAPRLLGAGQADARQALREVSADVRAALAWALGAGEAETALRLVNAMWMWWRMEGAFTEARGWAERALQLDGGDGGDRGDGADRAGGAARRADTLWAAGWLACHQRDFTAATVHAQELLDLVRASPSSLRERNALTLLGQVALAEHRYGEAVALNERALALAAESGAPWHHATSLLNLGTALVQAGDPEGARAVLEQALAEHERCGDRHFAARAAIELGYAAVVGGDARAARARFVDGARRFLELDERWGTAEAVTGLAVAAALHGDAETAALLDGAAKAAYADLATHVIAPDAEVAERVLSEARATVAEEAWAAENADGRGLPIGEAAAIGLDRLAGPGRPASATQR